MKPESTEILQDYFDTMQEQNKSRPHRANSSPRIPTEKELQGQCAPVKIIKYPVLATLPERLKFLQRQEPTVEFCKQCGISLKAYYRLLNGEMDI